VVATAVNRDVEPDLGGVVPRQERQIQASVASSAASSIQVGTSEVAA